MINVRRTFSKLVFVQIMLGTLAFCLASRDIGMLLVVGALGTVAWFVVERRGGKPMPQWIVGSGAIVASAWLVMAIFDQRDEPVRAMGNFILWLQLLLLFGKKSNREYAELLVLSLMLMVGATTINQAVIFGVLLVIYYTLALFTLLTFQFKVLADRVQNVRGDVASESAHDAVDTVPVGSGFRWQFRAMALCMGVVAAGVGVVVFLGLPRTSAGTGRGNQLSALQQKREVDFSPQINLDDPPPSTASREAVMNVTITLDDKPFGGPDQPQLIRGAALDRYDVIRHTWSTDARVRSQFVRFSIPTGGRDLIPLAPATRTMDARFTLRGRSPRTLFSLFPPSAIDSPELASVQFNMLDQTLSAIERPDGAIEYVVSSPVVVPFSFFTQLQSPDALDPNVEAEQDYWWGGYTPARTAVADIAKWVWSQELDESEGYFPTADEAREALRRNLSLVAAPNTVAEFWKLRIDALTQGAVSDFQNRQPFQFRGTAQTAAMELIDESSIDLAQFISGDTRQWNGYAKGWPVDADAVRALADAILVEKQVDRTSDLMIARALTSYVRDNYTYSLTNDHDTSGRDPTVAFLFDHRMGHCELFASGTAALARSLGMRARVVTGYLASEFVSTGSYYVVRKSDAHAWTEIYCEGLGWRTFDPTPPSEVMAERAGGVGALSWLTDLYDHIEFAWVGSIIAYDSRTRSGIFDSINQSINDSLMGDKGWFSEGMAKLDKAMEDASSGGWTARLTLLGAGVGLLAFIYAMYRLIRWCFSRLGRAGKSRVHRREFPQHVRFYPDMLTMLAAGGHARPDWQTPLAFAQSLAARDANRFAPVERLTRQFYELHYGSRLLDDERKAAIEDDMAQLKSWFREQLPEARRASTSP